MELFGPFDAAFASGITDATLTDVDMFFTSNANYTFKV